MQSENNWTIVKQCFMLSKLLQVCVKRYTTDLYHSIFSFSFFAKRKHCEKELCLVITRLQCLCYGFNHNYGLLCIQQAKDWLLLFVSPLLCYSTYRPFHRSFFHYFRSFFATVIGHRNYRMFSNVLFGLSRMW